VADDVMVGGRKIAGGALRVMAAARLYQGDVRTEEFGLNPKDVQMALAVAFERDFFQCSPDMAIPSLDIH
jgi:hypothetical protein